MQRTGSQSLRAQTTWAAVLCSVVTAFASADPPPTDPDGTIHVPGFSFPYSSLLSANTRAALKNPQRVDEAFREIAKACPPLMEAEATKWAAIRQCQADVLYKTPAYKALRARYDVTMTVQKIGGVPTEVFVPASGISPKNGTRVLINLHGGGFSGSARTLSHMESIPIAALGQIKVFSIDYRQAPDHRFPAASEDVAAVYKELLKTYQPGSIGIYGCSAGGLLTAQSVAWLQKKGLPLPGAVGMFCAAGGYYGEGDSGHFVAALTGLSLSGISDPRGHPYFKDVDPKDALAFPIRSPELLSKFPPSLLITSTRDQGLSSVVYMHSRLVALGVEAELHVWEGLGHGFFNDPNLPESREVHDVTVKFFDRYLGRQRASTSGPVLAKVPVSTLEQSLLGEVDRFVASDAQSPPEPCRTLFVGSSSIVYWKSLQDDMAPLRVLNRGFGGSQIEYVNRWFDRIVAPYRPSAIVFYAGENDIADGKPVERVVADFDAFMKLKDSALGTVPVYFISLKPSKLRFEQLEQQAAVNRAIRARAGARADLHYIDVAGSMLQDGKPKDIFLADDLHMGPEGYKIWTKAVRAALLRNAKAEVRSCRQASSSR